MEDIKQKLSELEDDIKNIKRAFPKSAIGEIDYMGHRNYHDEVVAAAREQRMFWQGLRNDLAKKGAWAVILVVIGLAAHGLMFKMGMIR